MVILGACSPAADATGPLAAESPVTRARGGISTDQPCTRAVVAEPDVVRVPFQLQDLEGMIPAAVDIPGLIGFEDDMFTHGYHDNAELNTVVPNPPSTCDDLERFGRITGFGIGYARPADSAHHLLISVHLFGDEAAAMAWPDAFFAPMAATARNPGGPESFTFEELAGLPDNTIVAEHVGADGVRTWASTVRGLIVGWVIDLHPEGEPTVDIAAAARILAEHIDAVTADVAVGAREGPDAAHVMSAVLPRSAYAGRGEGLAWDSFFGGCQDAVERGMVAGDQARTDAERFGRVSGCTAMYSPPAGRPAADGTVRVFSAVSVYGEPEAASESIAAGLAELEGRGGGSFEVPALGDEAHGLVTPVDAGESKYTDTRVVLRRGPYVGVVALHSTAAADASAEFIDLGTALDQRMRDFLEP